MFKKKRTKSKSLMKGCMLINPWLTILWFVKRKTEWYKYRSMNHYESADESLLSADLFFSKINQIKPTLAMEVTNQLTHNDSSIFSASNYSCIYVILTEQKINSKNEVFRKWIIWIFICLALCCISVFFSELLAQRWSATKFTSIWLGLRKWWEWWRLIL